MWVLLRITHHFAHTLPSGFMVGLCWIHCKVGYIQSFLWVRLVGSLQQVWAKWWAILKRTHILPLVKFTAIAGFFEETLTKHPLGIFWENWWVLFEYTHALPTGYSEHELVSTFKKHPECACQVCSEQIAGFFEGKLVSTFWKYPAWTHWVKWGWIVSEPKMNLQGTCWVSDSLPPVWSASLH